MASDFSKGVMISLNEHMAQTLLDGMTSAIRKEKLDLDMQIQGLEMLVESMEALNHRVTRYMDELRSDKENIFFYEDLDLEGLDEWEPMPETTETAKGIMRIPSPITYNMPMAKKFSSKTLSPLKEDKLEARDSFKSMTSPTKGKLSLSTAGPVHLGIEMPHTPPLSSIEEPADMKPDEDFVEPKTLAILKSEFRPIDPKKIPKRKPVPSQLEIPTAKNIKAFKRKEVPKRIYEMPTAQSSSATMSTFNIAIRHTEAIYTPPITDEESSPVSEKKSMESMIPNTNSNGIYQPKPRRVKSKQLKIAIPHRKSSAGKALKTPLRTPSTASGGSAKLGRRAMEELDRAVAAIGLDKNEVEYVNRSNRNMRPVVRRMDSGREKRMTSVKRKMSMGKRRRYTSGIPRCDSPVLGQFEMVVPVLSPNRRD